MNEIRTVADRLQVGDIIVGDKSDTTVREIATGPGGCVTVNAGSPDEMNGHAWENVTVLRSKES